MQFADASGWNVTVRRSTPDEQVLKNLIEQVQATGVTGRAVPTAI